MITEKKIEQELRDGIKRIGGICYKFNSQGNNGVPDRICIIPGGDVYFIETKRSEGGRLSKLQKWHIGQLKALHQKVRVVSTMAELVGFFADLGYAVLAEHLAMRYEI